MTRLPVQEAKRFYTFRGVGVVEVKLEFHYDKSIPPAVFIPKMDTLIRKVEALVKSAMVPGILTLRPQRIGSDIAPAKVSLRRGSAVLLELAVEITDHPCLNVVAVKEVIRRAVLDTIEPEFSQLFEQLTVGHDLQSSLETESARDSDISIPSN